MEMYFLIAVKLGAQGCTRQIWLDGDTAGEMTADQEHIRKSLRLFMERRGLKAKSWARKAGIGDNTLRHILRGNTGSPTQRILEKLARSENVAVGVLTGELPDPLDLPQKSTPDGRSDVFLSASELTEADVENLQLMVRRLGEIKDQLSKLNAQQELSIELLRELINAAKGVNELPAVAGIGRKRGN